MKKITTILFITMIMASCTSTRQVGCTRHAEKAMKNQQKNVNQQFPF